MRAMYHARVDGKLASTELRDTYDTHFDKVYRKRRQKIQKRRLSIGWCCLLSSVL